MTVPPVLRTGAYAVASAFVGYKAAEYAAEIGTVVLQLIGALVILVAWLVFARAIYRTYSPTLERLINAAKKR